AADAFAAGGDGDARPRGESMREAAESLARPLPRPTRSLAIPAGMWTVALLTAWTVGVLLHLGRLALGLRALTRLGRTAVPLDSATAAIVAPLLPHAGTRAVRILASRRVPTPVTIGYRSPVILLPPSVVAGLDADALACVVRHELAHVRRRDDWWVLAQRVLEAVLFHHPAARWVARRADEAREMACDEAVVAATGAARGYARALLRVAELSAGAPPLALAPSAAASGSALAARVEMVIRPPRPLSPGARRMVGLALGAAALLAGIALVRVPSPIAVGLPRVGSTAPLLATRSPVSPVEVRIVAGTARGAAGLRLDSIFTRYEAYGFSGAVLVAHRGEVILEKGYGLADRKRGVRVGAATRFSTAGMTKAVTAAAILRLEDEGRLRTSDLVSAYLGPFPGAKAGATIHHLLTHTDGLAALGAPVFRAKREAFVDAMRRAPMAFAPGTGSRYTDFGHSLLGAVIERVTGERYERYVREHVLRPAGMTHTRFEGDPLPSGDTLLATEYAGPPGEPRAIPPREYRWGRRASLGMISTVGDLHRLYLALQGSAIVSDRARREMFTPADTLGQGYGWAMTRTARGATLRRRIAGTRGLEGELLHNVDEDWVAVILINSRVGWRFAIWREIRSAMAGVAGAPLPPPVARGAAPAFAAVDGTYELPGGRAIRVRHAGDSLRLAGAPVARLFRNGEPGAPPSLALVPAEGGGWVALHVPTTRASRLTFEPGLAGRAASLTLRTPSEVLVARRVGQ
ncbi:MAG: serine hydrolase, partial [Gemmatimonadaceae bacterium]